MRLRGGSGGLPAEALVGIAAGGLIEQNIVQDNGTHCWDVSQTKVINVQILNSLRYEQITGNPPHDPSIDAFTYVKHGYPFFKLYEEPTDVTGDFSLLQSVAKLDGVNEESLGPHKIVEINKPSEAEANCDELLNSAGPLTEFRSLKQLEEEMLKTSADHSY